MSDPITAITAAEIIGLAFGGFVKGSAGEAARALTSKALKKTDALRQKIVAWFRGKSDDKAERAIAAIQKQGDEKSFNKLCTYLDDELEAQPVLAQELQQMAQQIINISNQEKVEMGDMNQLNEEGAKGYQIQANRIDRIGDDYTG